MLTVAFGKSTMSRTQFQLWYNRFKEGREDVNYGARARTGRQSTSTTDENIETAKKMILDNRRITIREVSNDVGISFVSCQAIFTDVTCFRQKQRRMDIAQNMLTTFNDDPDVLKKVMTGDESTQSTFQISLLI